MKKIVTIPYPTLRQEAKEVLKFNFVTERLIKDLWQALESSSVPGVGIAAPQIGVSERVFILRNGSNNFETFVNPKLIWASEVLTTGLRDKKGEEFLEGCLSIPLIYGAVDRPDSVRIEYFDQKGKLQNKSLDEPFSRYFQHELDHLNGVLFTDLTIAQKKQLFRVNDHNELEEIDLNSL